jgi:hypothetical protein
MKVSVIEFYKEIPSPLSLLSVIPGCEMPQKESGIRPILLLLYEVINLTAGR